VFIRGFLPQSDFPVMSGFLSTMPHDIAIAFA
jgi:hypothetical protein